ncbi:MAG: LytTR family DNA-binding domain-containing protein, partial [Butyricicoccus sp.]|nr:LytTR family DNA-binding domain-containing protein [Butyricicoccus sp.]
ILWVGSIQYQFLNGFEAAADDLRQSVKDFLPCHLLKQEFTAVQNCGNACTVVGRYLTTTDESTGYFMQVQQRCSFTWELIKGEPKIKHCHVSNPMGELQVKEGERFPLVMGEMARKYQLQWLNKKQGNRRIIVTDKNDVVHFLAPSEVIYAQANRRNSVIHTSSGGEIQARMSITDFLAAAGDGFSSIHRSYVLNNAYISRIQKREVVMANGSILPIPEKRYTEIRDKLEGIYNL